MSYLALARKWRPTQFNEVVGQAHVLTALENALTQNRLHHAYLFSGTRGVGKTTIARLLAKGLNCEQGITSTPCGQCDACREIDEGRFVDLLEIDAASRTKVEDTRELLDNVQYKPARGRFKVYLIDEVHMLSRHSFNALLKTLEEPPEYVKFLLATTDPQKLPVTVLSRCLQFNLKPIGVEQIQAQLSNVLQQEHIQSDDKALSLIAHAADGSMRDALSLTDQAIALGNGSVEGSLVSHMLGTLDTDQALHLLQSVASKTPQGVMSGLQSLAENGVEWDGLLQQLATQLHRIAMYQALPATLDEQSPDAEKVIQLAQVLTPQDVQLYYQIALKGRADLAVAPTARIGMEMILLRMLAFRPSQQSVLEPVTASSAVTNTQVTPPVSVKTDEEANSSSEHILPTQAVSAHPTAGQSVETPTYQQQNVSPVVSEASADDEVTSTPAAEVNAEATLTSSGSESSAAASHVGGLRHQLRSKRKNAASAADGQRVKKTPAASKSKESVLERVSQRAQPTTDAQWMSPNAPTNQVMATEHTERDYQWRPTQPVIEKTKSDVTPTKLKKALEHEKTPEMSEKLTQEAAAQNEWAALIQRLTVPKLVEQLALNSVFAQQGNQIELTLRPSHAHLNTEKAHDELSTALNEVLGQTYQLMVSVGEQGQTPLELRESLYQNKLSQAIESLSSDPNVQFIQRRFNGTLDEDSVRPI
ncbi:MAG: DNA polymerase III subunit gamma/tau [Vibrio sp.]